MSTLTEAIHRIAAAKHPCAQGHKSISLFLNIKAMTKGRVKAQWWSRIPGATLFYESKPCATDEEARALAHAWLERQNRPCGNAHPPRFLDTTTP